MKMSLHEPEGRKDTQTLGDKEERHSSNVVLFLC